MLLNDLKKAALCVAAGFAVTMFGGCDSQKSTGAPAGAGAQRAPQVSVTEIQPTELDMTTTLQGRTASYLVADVRPQVAGILQKRLFKEGSEVKEGQALYQIDPAVYEAAVASAKAELQRAQAVLYQTRLTANRYAQLVKTNAISKQNNDDAQAAYKQAQAAVAAAEAGLKERPDQPGLHDRTFSDQRTHRPLFSYTRRIAFRTSGPEHGRRSDTGSDLCRRDPVK